MLASFSRALICNFAGFSAVTVIVNQSKANVRHIIVILYYTKWQHYRPTICRYRVI